MLYLYCYLRDEQLAMTLEYKLIRDFSFELYPTLHTAKGKRFT